MKKNNLQYPMKKKMYRLAIGLLAIAGVVSCQEQIDDSARYVFKARTIGDYLSAHDQFSQ